MKRIILLSLSLATIAAISGFTFFMHASGITGCSGSPRDGGSTCAGCHSGGTAPTVNITATPAFGTGNTYVPSTTYTISVVASGTSRYGLNLEILNGTSSSAANAGTFGTVVTTNCTKSGTAPTTITHNQSSSSGTFSFRWTAPASGSVYIYSCTLGANGNGSTSGDKIKQTNLTLTAASSAPTLSVTTTSVNDKCSGGNTGSATATANGTAPYTYSWNTTPVQTTATATGLAAGSYIVTVHDVNGSTTSTVTVTAPSAVTSNVTATTASCGSSNGTANVSASGGTPGYTYLWSNGKATASITGLSAGIYSVTVTDANGCTSTGSANVTNANGPSVVATATNASSCSSSDGTASSSVSGGSTPYTYMWNNGQTTSGISGLLPGSYTVTVTDHSGCVDVQTTVVSCTSSNADAGVSSVSNPTGTTCASTLIPTVTIKNFGSSTLTTCTINYYVDAPPASTYTWNGSLASGATANVSLSAITGLSAGAHTFYSSTSNPNGVQDVNTSNDQSQSSFTISNTTLAIPLIEGFESSTNLPSGWTLVDPDNNVTWQIVTTVAHTGTNCIGFDNCDGLGSVNMTGRVDRFVTSAYDFTSASNTAGLSFDVAYSVLNYKNQLYPDTLVVYSSTDCGTTWNQIYLKGGLTLSNNNSTTISCWSPSSSDWRTDNINVGNLSGKPSVLFAFENRSDWGEWIYLDDINIITAGAGVTSVNPLSGFGIYPNPANTLFTIEGVSNADKIHYSIYNVVGEEVKAGDIATNGNSFSGKISISEIPRGMYFIKISDGKNFWTKKLNVQ